MNEITKSDKQNEKIPGPTDSLHRYLQEKNRRLADGEDTDSLLSQELALVGDGVVVADLDLLKAEGTFDKSERVVPKNEAKYNDILSLDRLKQKDTFYGLEDTDWIKMDELILQFFEKNESVDDLQITSIYDLDPAVATTWLMIL